ncbi:MAG TPA: cytidine deaminase [Patescibacteria group bacterium]|nr:cytidine deaminase [Patescibacteria group bacterium]
MDNLLKAARTARENAYAPYSGFAVGAAVLGASGKIYSGCNIENASYGLSNCAERTAIFKAVSAGERILLALAVVADTPEPVSPCGACRQVMAEFDIPQVMLENLQGDRRVTTTKELLPCSFNKTDFRKEGDA